MKVGHVYNDGKHMYRYLGVGYLLAKGIGYYVMQELEAGLIPMDIILMDVGEIEDLVSGGLK